MNIVRKPDLIQVEFFPPLKELFPPFEENVEVDAYVADLAGRISDGVRIKTVIRVHDPSPKRTILMAAKIHECRENKGRMVTERLESTRTGILKRLLGFQANREYTAGRQEGVRAKTSARNLVMQQIGSGADIGIEDYPGGPFRLVHDNERHELLEKIKKLSVMMVFVWQDTEDLLVDAPGRVSAAVIAP